MTITKEEYEVYDKVRNCISKRTEEIFHLLKDVSLSWRESYEGCTVDGDLEFRVGGHYLGEYDYTLFNRPLEYLFMTDEEIIKAEEEREKEIKKAEELKNEEWKKETQKRELAELERLKKKYESQNMIG